MSAKAEARFGEAAIRLSGQAALLIGWSPQTFWTATPAELAAVVMAATPPPGDSIDRSTLTAMMERDAHG